MTFYPDLEHLFEELDTYQIDCLLNRASILQASTQFKKVLDAISANREKILANRDTDYKKFCKEEDYTITVTKYINKLNKPIKSRSPASPNDVAGKAAKAAKTAPQPTSEQTDKSANENNYHGNVM